MKRLGGRIALCALLLTVALVGSSLAASDTQTVKVGLAYSSGALASANLENSVGNGYQFGYYDGAGTFISLGSTDTTQIDPAFLEEQPSYDVGGDGSVVTAQDQQDFANFTFVANKDTSATAGAAPSSIPPA